MPADGGVGWSDPSAIPPNSAFSRQLAGVVINENTALQILTVMACVRLISGVVSRLPLDAFVRQGKTRVPLEPEPAILSDPFAGFSRRDGIRQGVISLMLTGNAYYLVVARDGNGRPLMLMPLPPQQVTVRIVKGHVEYKVNHRPVPSADVVHLRWVTLPGGVVGLSPIEYAAQGLGISLGAEEYGARFYAQGSHLSGVLESDQTLSKETARRIAYDFQNRHGGLAQAHLPLVLDSGLKWAPIQVPPEAAQFLATRAFQRGEIAMLYGVPPHLIGDTSKSTSWGTGIQDQKLDFSTFTLEDYTAIFEDAWNGMTPAGVRCKFNFDALLRANTVDRYNAYLVGRTGGWLSNEEIRALEDMEPSGDPVMDKYDQPLNSSPKPAPAGSKGTGGDAKAL